MIEEAFAVAAEFKFDVGDAILNTKTLQDSVDGLSKSAGSALTSLSYLATGLVAHLGLGSGGLLSILTQSVQVSEEFNASALDFANNITSNIQVLSGNIGTFNEKLATSQMLMEKISDTSIKFGLDRKGLSDITQLVSSPLAARKKLGTDYQGGIELAKNMMIASESVGLPQHAGAEQLARGLSPGQGVGGKLFERLIQTPEFRQAHVMHPQQLANMNQDKKIDLLTAALKGLGGNADFLNERLNHLGAQFMILKNQVQAFLKPIGDALLKPLIKVFKGVNEYLSVHGKEIGQTIGNLIGNVFEDPKALLIGVMQLKNLGHDFKKAAAWAPWITLLSFGLEKLGISLGGGLLLRGLMVITSLFTAAGLSVAGLVWYFSLFSKAMWVLRLLVADIIVPFTILLGFFQIISRAKAIAKVKDIEAMLTLTPRIGAVLIRLKDAFDMLMTPINIAINQFAEWISWLFETSIYLKIFLPLLEGFAGFLSFLGVTAVLATATIAGLSYAIAGMVDDIMHLKNPFKNFARNFNENTDDFLNKNLKGDPAKSVSNHVYNVGKIEARFDMREQLEPDRVAFAVTTHLKRLVINPTQGKGQSIFGGFASAGIAGAT